MLLYYPMALVHSPLVPTPDEPAAEGAQQRHAAMVRATDAIVGKLVHAAGGPGPPRADDHHPHHRQRHEREASPGRRLGREVRGAKAKMVEAGTAMPFIVNGPGLVPEGVVTNALTDFTDLLPTLADLSGR